MLHALLVSLVTIYVPQDDVTARLRELDRALETEDAEVRAGVYERIAALDEGVATPNPRVAKALAGGLEDDSFAVREAALRLLVSGHDPEETVRGVLSGIDATLEAWKAVDREAAAMNGRRGKYDPKKNLGLDEFNHLVEALAHVPYMLESFGHVPDERVEKALAKITRQSFSSVSGPNLIAAAKGCLAAGNARATGTVVDLMLRLGKALEKDKVPPRHERDGPPLLMDLIVVSCDSARAKHYDELELALEEHAETHSLDPVPIGGVASWERWKGWWKANEPKLPAAPRKLTTVLRIELPERETDDGGKKGGLEFLGGRGDK